MTTATPMWDGDGIPIDRFVLVADATVLLLVPVLLGVVQFGVPEALRTLLTYESDAVTLHGLFGHWLVHYTGSHFLENLGGYLLLVGMIYVLAWGTGTRRWYRFSFLTILVVVPALSIAGSAVAFERILPGLSYTSRGASGIVAALLGLLYVFGVDFVRRIVDLRAGISIGGSMLIAALVGLLVRVGSPSVRTVALIVGAAALVLLLDVGVRLRSSEIGSLPWRSLVVLGVVLYGITVVLYVFLVGLFPADPFSGKSITNVFSHTLGFGLGTLIGVWGHRYWTGDSWI